MEDSKLRYSGCDLEHCQGACDYCSDHKECVQKAQLLNTKNGAKLRNLVGIWARTASWKLWDDNGPGRAPDYETALDAVRKIKELGYEVICDLNWIPGELNKLEVKDSTGKLIMGAVAGKEFSFAH